LSSPVPQTLQKGIYGACLGILALLGAGCGSSSGPADLSQAGVQEHEASPWLTVKNLRATVYKGTSVESVVRAAMATVNQNADVAVLDSVEATVFDKEDWSTRLKSKQGEMFLKDSPERKCSKNDLVLSGGVFMESKQGLTMTVPSVHYISEKELFVSSGGRYEQRFPMEKGYWRCSGNWFEANKDMTKITSHESVMRSFPAERQPAHP
jgi:hypothetical protein